MIIACTPCLSKRKYRKKNKNGIQENALRTELINKKKWDMIKFLSATELKKFMH